MELLESTDAEASEYASTFCQLIEAVCDKDDGDDDDHEIDDDKATELWDQIEVRLRGEYTRTQGGFARLMNGGNQTRISAHDSTCIQPRQELPKGACSAIARRS